jgi:aryl-alcohol dehydrogenase-like predicted oxidoreductase
MRNRQLGKSGLLVSELCLGTATFGGQTNEATSRAIIDKAAEAGLNFIDTANGYPIPFSADIVGRSEEIIGRWLKGKRHQFTIATKVRTPMGSGPNDEGLSRRHIWDQVDESLRRLGCDYIDIYYIHYPDALTPFEETLRALNDVVSAGKVRYIACSNHSCWQVARMLWLSDLNGWPPFICVEERYNAIWRQIESDLVPLCSDRGLGVIGYGPLAGGLLTGKYKKGSPPLEGARFAQGGFGQRYQELYWHDAEFDEVGRLRTVCDQYGHNLATVAIAWVLAQPTVCSTVIGASHPDQLDVLLAATEVSMNDEERSALDETWNRLPRRRLITMPSMRTGPGVY